MTSLKQKYLLIILLFLIITIGISVSLTQKSQDIRKKAAQVEESEVPLSIRIPKPEFEKGEVIVKFKSPVPELKVNSLKMHNLEQTNLPPVLNELNKDYQITSIEKIFRGFEEPDKELAKIKEKFSQEINEGKRVIDEKELLKLNLANIYKITFTKKNSPAQIIQKYSTNPDVEYIEPNYQVKTQTDANDPFYSSSNSWGQQSADLWGMHRIRTSFAWDQSTCSKSVVIANIDTGVDRNHEDLQDNMWVNTAEIPNNGIDDDGNGYIDDYYGWNFVANNNNPLDDHGHGTHTAGTIAAVGNNNLGVVGVCWQARIMAVKFLDSHGMGWTDDAVKALYYAANNGARITSNSWGGGYNKTIDETVSYLHSLGVTTIAAAGNNYGGDALDMSPASSDGAIAVAAIGLDDKRATFSNQGRKIDVAAPGVGILSLRAANTDMYCPLSCKNHIVAEKYYWANGTSMATPHVAGLAAMLLSVNPLLTNEEIRQIIRHGALDLGNPGQDNDFGFGLIQADKTIALASNKPLTVQITTPQSKSVISGTTLEVNGSAFGENFQKYTLEVGIGRDPINWNLIVSATTSDNPVKNGVLGTIDLSKFPDNNYTLRLTAFDTRGNTYQSQVFDVQIDNFELEITSPLSLINKSGTTPIYGTAKVKGAFTLQNYSLEWKEDTAISFWSAGGIELVNNGKKGISNDLLGTWDLAKIKENTRYLIRLTIRSINGFSQEIITKIYYSPEKGMRSGWPQKIGLPNLLFGDRIVLASDVNNNNKKEVIATDYDRKIYLWNDQGVLFPGWPVEISVIDSGEVILSVLAADLDGNQDKEIIAKTSIGRLFVFNKAGLLLNGWPKTALSPEFFTVNTPVIEDLDQDGKFEIIVNQGANMINVLSYDGTAKPGWPVSLDSSSPKPEFYISTNDIDGDSNKEVIVNSLTKIYVLTKDGSFYPGWPVEKASDQNIPISGDIDKDGKAEIITGNTGHLIIWGYDGKIKKEIVVDPKVDYSWNNPSLGDINNDGYLEIVTVDYSGKIHALNHRGVELQGFPVDGGESLGFNYSPAIADIDNDGQKEILVCGLNIYQSEFAGWTFLYAYTAKGTLKSDYPKMVQIEGTPTITDLDNNGELELLFVSGDEIHIWDLKKKYSQKSLAWPQEFYNERFTAGYSSTISTTGCYKPCNETTTCQSGLVCEDLSCQPEKVCSGKTICVKPNCPYDKTCQCRTPFPTRTVD